MEDQIIHNLSQSVQNATPIDHRLIDLYVPVATSDAETIITRFMPVINAIVNSPHFATIDQYGLCVQLLEHFLTVLDYAQITSIYPHEFILANLLDLNNVTISKLCLKILVLNHTQFLATTPDILLQLVQQYLNNASLDIAIVNQIELLVRRLVDDASPFVSLLVSAPEFTLVYSEIKHSDNTTLISRLLDYYLLLPQISPDHYTFSKQQLASLFDDPLFAIIYVQFVSNLFDKVTPKSNVNALIVDLIEIFQATDEDYLKSEIVGLLAQISYSPEAANLVIESTVLKTYLLINVYDRDATDIGLLSRLNPQVILLSNPDIYIDILSNLSLSSVAYFSILLNFIELPAVFDQFTPTYFSNTTLASLSKDQLFQILHRISQFEHSTSYLLNSLPSIINDNLLSSDIQNQALWQLKLDTLENLVGANNEFWKQHFEDELYLMKYGRKIRDVEPRVDVLDETA